MVVGAAIVICLKAAIPMIQLPPLWKMIGAMPAFYTYMLFMMLVHALIPSHVEVRKDRVHVVTGESHWVVKSEAVRGTRIVIFAFDRIRLRIFYVHKDRTYSKTFAIGRKVNLDALADALAVRPQVWDAQDRYKVGR